MNIIIKDHIHMTILMKTKKMYEPFQNYKI